MLQSKTAQEQHVVLVDAEDNAIGTLGKRAAHEQGICHRAFSVFIFRQQGANWQCLLQQRQWDKYHAGGLWTNTCCSHPFPGEATESAAKRRLQEEMGFVVPLEYVDKFHYIAHFDNGLIENEIDHVFVGLFEPHCHITPNPNEVAQHAWMDVPILQANIKSNPDIYTPWLSAALCIAMRKQWITL